MIVDLLRNDLGRVADPGTVNVTSLFRVEDYETVFQMTSEIECQVDDSRTFDEIFSALFPCGSITGAPKLRTMEIIDELEPHRRGPYAGAVGYLDFTGNMDTCIALRTIVMQGQTAYVQAGAGLVADSVPESEYEETLNKAKGLLKAIEVAERQL